MKISTIAALVLPTATAFSTAPVRQRFSTECRASRRDVLLSPTIGAAALWIPSPSYADTEFRDFIDPQGLFTIRVPTDFYAIRRQTKGDLPDAKGKGRRGASIFTAGNMAKAEVVAIERYDKVDDDVATTEGLFCGLS